MTRFLRHIVYPMVFPTLFFINAYTPKEVLGCRNRGLAALAITCVSMAGAFWTVAQGRKGSRAGDPGILWWFVTSQILAIPAIGLVILA